MQSICRFNQPRLPPVPLFAACGYNKDKASSAKNFFFRRKAIMYCTYHSCHAAQAIYIYIYIWIFVSRFSYRGGFLNFPKLAPRVAKKWLALCRIGWGWGVRFDRGFKKKDRNVWKRRGGWVWFATLGIYFSIHNSASHGTFFFFFFTLFSPYGSLKSTKIFTRFIL